MGARAEQPAPAELTAPILVQVVEDGYEFFAKRQLVTLFSAPNYCGEFDNAGAMMSVDETLMCSFQVGMEEDGACGPWLHPVNLTSFVSFRSSSQPTRTRGNMGSSVA